MKKLVIVLLVIFSFSFSINGYIVVEESRGSEGHVTVVSVSTVYIVKDAMRIDTKTTLKMDMDKVPEEIRGSIPPEITKETSIIQKIVNNKVKIYSVDHKKKTYTDLSHIPEFMVISFLAPYIECDSNTQKCTVKEDLLKPTNEYKKIGKYKVRKIIIKFGAMQNGGKSLEIPAWFTKDNKDLINAERLKTEVLINAAKKTDFGKSNPSLLKDIKRFTDQNIKKYGVAIRLDMPEGEIVIKSVKRKNINKKIFTVPAGYKEVKSPL